MSEQIDVLSGPLTHHVGALIRAIERGERVCEVANLDLLAAVERAYRLGVPLHAVVAVLPAPARASDGPLHGLAVAVKDIVDVAGSPRGNGNPIDMAGPAAAPDAPVVAALRAAGADVFALASLLEYAAGAPHPDLPEARNPVRPDRTAGGSSGGSAALVGAGVCRAALGTDTGGSIRIPAAYCGVVGLKPSHGVLDLAGVTALSPTLDHLGVIADTVQTASRVMAALTLSPVEARASVASDCRLGVLGGAVRRSPSRPGAGGHHPCRTGAAGGCRHDAGTAGQHGAGGARRVPGRHPVGRGVAGARVRRFVGSGPLRGPDPAPVPHRPHRRARTPDRGAGTSGRSASTGRWAVGWR